MIRAGESSPAPGPARTPLWPALLVVSIAAASIAALGPCAGPTITHADCERIGIGDRLDELAAHLRAFREAHGRWPTNDEGLVALGDVGEPVDFSDSPRSTSLALYWRGRILGGSAVLLRADIGPVTPWLLPYLYENRGTAPAAAFADSPVDRDGDRRWSRRVADGVFVWCVDARRLARRERALRLAQWAVAGGGVLLAATSAFLWLRARRRAGAGWTAVSAAVDAAVLLAAALAGPFLDAIAPKAVQFSYDLDDRPAIARECEAALADYRDHGVIRPETSQRLVDGIRALGEQIREAERRRF